LKNAVFQEYLDKIFNIYVRFEVFTTATMKSRRSGGTYRLHHQDEINQRPRTTLAVNVNAGFSSLILSTLMMQAISSSETSALTRSTRLHIPEDDILQSHHRENLKYYITLTG
jgi:hypothetical protein